MLKVSEAEKYFRVLSIFNIFRFRDRKELLLKADAIFDEVVQQQRLQEAKSERLKQQQAMCSLLYDKVRSDSL